MGKRERGGQEDTVSPKGVLFFEVALSSFPFKWSGVQLRQDHSSVDGGGFLCV